MEWSGRAPAPPAIEAGQGRQRQGARHVSNTQNRDRSSRILATPPDVLSPHMVRVTRTWLERQISTGDRTILGKISKRGNRYLCDLVWAGVGLGRQAFGQVRASMVIAVCRRWDDRARATRCVAPLKECGHFLKRQNYLSRRLVTFTHNSGELCNGDQLGRSDYHRTCLGIKSCWGLAHRSGKLMGAEIDRRTLDGVPFFVDNEAEAPVLMKER